MIGRRGFLQRIAGLGGALAGSAIFASTAGAQDDAAAREFLRDLLESAVQQLTTPEIAESERERRFRRLFRSNFDLPAIGRFVLARYWRSANAEQRDAFLLAFENVLVQRFVPLMKDYTAESVELGRVSRDGGSGNIYMVASLIKDGDGEPIRVDWRLREHDGRFRIVDVVAEGVSMAITHRQEYASAIASQGGSVDALTQQLNALVARGAFAPK